jgi:predicted negative regulator of RcsB-dependent stress response
MVTTVVIINFLIALLLTYIAWQVWQLKRTLANIADKLSAYERATYAALHTAPENIYIGQKGVYSLRQQQQGLKVQIQKLQQIFSLMILGRNLWRRYFSKLGYKSGNRSC